MYIILCTGFAEWYDFRDSISSEGPLKWSPLTKHHIFGSEVMLGKDRNNLLEHLVRRIITRTESYNEANPYHAVISGPWQGKSLFLDCLCERLRSEGWLAVNISYSSETPFLEAENENIPAFFFARMIHSLTRATGMKIEWSDFKSFSFTKQLDWNHFDELCKKVIPNYNSRKLVTVIDDLTNACPRNASQSIRHSFVSSIMTPIFNADSTVVFSGVNQSILVIHGSGRPTDHYVLNPFKKAQRMECAEVKNMIDGHYHGKKYPHIVYECAKFSPGLLGVWLDMLEDMREVQGIEDLKYPSVNAVLQNVQADNKYFARYWEDCFKCDTFKISRSEYDYPNLYHSCDEACVHVLCSRCGFVNPLIILHNKIFSEFSVEERALFSMVQVSLQTDSWGPSEKGKVLNALLAAALGLRQIYCKTPISLSNILCGKCHYGSLPSTYVEFRKSFITDLETFPCHGSTHPDDVGHHVRRCKEGVEALKKHGLLYPSHPSNAGCDLAWVLEDKYTKSVVILFFVTKYYYRTSWDNDAPSREASMLLNAIMSTPSPLGDCNVDGVCIIFCASGEKGVSYNLNHKHEPNAKSIQTCIGKLKKRGISVSLNSIADEKEWISILSPSLFYVLPDVMTPNSAAEEAQC